MLIFVSKMQLREQPEKTCNLEKVTICSLKEKFRHSSTGGMEFVNRERTLAPNPQLRQLCGTSSVAIGLAEPFQTCLVNAVAQLKSGIILTTCSFYNKASGVFCNNAERTLTVYASISPSYTTILKIPLCKQSRFMYRDTAKRIILVHGG